MALYLISYDIRSKNHDYSSLTNRLESLGAVKILFSEWLYPDSRVQFAKSLADDLWKHLRPDDSLLVQEVGKDAAWANLQITTERMNQLLQSARF